MAARLNPRNTESVLAKIKAGQLVEKLQNHVLEGVALEKSQVTAATWLLSRLLAQAEGTKQVNVNLTLPDLIKASIDAAQ